MTIRSLLGITMLGAAMLGTAMEVTRAADLTDPTPVVDRSGSMNAVDGYNFKAGFVGGSLDGNGLEQFQGSFSMPMPFVPQMGIQGDFTVGNYNAKFDRDNYTGASGALHIFWRDPSIGALGAYGDWAYTSPEHGGRVTAEAALYNGRWTLEGIAGFQFGQHLDTRFVDEVDLNYYFTDNFRGSIGHRKTSRGHLGNIGFEWAASDNALAGWSVFGEFEAGQDNYQAGWAGLRYSFGANGKTLIEQDRSETLRIRSPRNFASITQCGKLAKPRKKSRWRDEMTTLCSSKDELRDSNAKIGKLK